MPVAAHYDVVRGIEALPLEARGKHLHLPVLERDQDGNLLAGELAEAITDVSRGGVRIVRQQDERLRLGRIRGVDACRRADEAVGRLCNHERRPHSHDPCGFAQDDLDAAGILVVARDLSRLLRGLDAGERDDSAF